MFIINFFKNPIVKKFFGTAGILLTGFIAISDEVEKRKRQEEIEEIKEYISELKAKESE